MFVFGYIQGPGRRKIKQHLKEKYKELFKRVRGTKVMFKVKASDPNRLIYVDKRSIGNMFGVSTNRNNVLYKSSVDENEQAYLDL